MRKLEKEMLEQINGSNHTYCATDWAGGGGNWTGVLTTDKLMRRIYAVMDLADAGQITDHNTSWYHNKNITCIDCE